jgi:secreted trypsin-like serine protease
MRFAFSASVLSVITAASDVRRLMIDGEVDELKAHPHAVAILYCNPPKSSSGSYVCAIHCSGSLIAPNVVLSAAHCIRDTGLPYGDKSDYVDYNKLYVLAGSTDYDTPDWTDNARIVRVKGATTGGYGKNIRFPMDGDVALLELNECISEIPGQIEYAKVATVATEPIGDNCKLSTIAGFGIISNAPDSARDDDGQRRVAADLIHSYGVCRDSFIAAAYGWTTASQGRPAQVDIDTLVPETNICTGGSSIQSVCFGDSGGGYTVDLPGSTRKQVIAVVSFGFGEFCTTSADYNTRLSFRAPWMVGVMNSSFATCPNWTVQESFSSWPVTDWTTDMLSSEYKRSRCSAGQWQCESGPCISTSAVCNGATDCSDGSDEKSSYCSLAGGRRLMAGSELDAEFEQLLASKHLDDKEMYNMKRVEAVTGGNKVVIAGVLKTAGRKARLGHEKFTKPDAATVAPKNNLKAIDCTTALNNYGVALDDAKAQSTINDQWDATRLSAACKAVTSCTGSRSNPSLYADSLDTCPSLEDFLAWNTTLPTYAKNFDKNFNSKCNSGVAETTAVPTGGKDAGTTDGVAAATTTKSAEFSLLFPAVVAIVSLALHTAL